MVLPLFFCVMEIESCAKHVVLKMAMAASSWGTFTGFVFI